jgi:hypothetical protein
MVAKWWHLANKDVGSLLCVPLRPLRFTGFRGRFTAETQRTQRNAERSVEQSAEASGFVGEARRLAIVNKFLVAV